jgi:hypothetical protein
MEKLIGGWLGRGSVTGPLGAPSRAASQRRLLPLYSLHRLSLGSAAGWCEWSAQARYCRLVRLGVSLGTPVKLKCDSGTVGTMAYMAGRKKGHNGVGHFPVGFGVVRADP